MTRNERAATAASLLLGNARLRIAIRGRSMKPSMAEPMVMHVGPADDARVGDVLVFDHGSVSVAHRIVARPPGGFRTAGDAQPHIVETVAASAVIGRVVELWSDASASAERIDTGLHRLRSWYYGRFHRIRRAMFLLGEKLDDLLYRAQPRRRPRVAARILDAIIAAHRNDRPALIAALHVEAEAFARTDARHRCGAMLAESARRLDATGDIGKEVGSYLRNERLRTLVSTERMQRAVNSTIAVLQSAAIPFALLKGAARIYARSHGAASHASDDVDVFVHERDVDRAIAAFRGRGWKFRETTAEIRRFRAQHHHAASLFSPSGDFPVEIHHALAEPGTLSIDTRWDALSTHLVFVEGACGAVLRFDAFATALHLAIHAIGLTRLRDLALLADALTVLSEDARDELAMLIRRERRDPVRLYASFALASSVAGFATQRSPDVAAYIRWALCREDLPLRLRLRSNAAETYFARPRSPWDAICELVPWWSRGAQVGGVPLRIAARCVANFLAITYANRMSTEHYDIPV